MIKIIPDGLCPESSQPPSEEDQRRMAQEMRDKLQREADAIRARERGREEAHQHALEAWRRERSQRDRMGFGVVLVVLGALFAFAGLADLGSASGARDGALGAFGVVQIGGGAVMVALGLILRR